MIALSPLVIVQDVLILGCMMFLGALVVRVVVRGVDALAIISLCLGLGGGLFSFVLFLLSWAGIPLNRASVVVTYALAAVALLLTLVATRRSKEHGEMRPSSIAEARGLSRWLARGVWGVILLLGATSAVLAVGMSYFTWDAIAAWAVKGYGIALVQSIFGGVTWGHAGLMYPLNVPLLIAVFRIMDGDVLPGSTLLFPISYLSLLIGCYRFWVRKGVRPLLASSGVLLVACTPLFFVHASNGYTNLMFSHYLIMGVLWSVEAMESGGRGEAFLAGLLMSLALWTRPEGWVMCAAALLALALTEISTGRRRLRALPLLLPILLVGGVWISFLRSHLEDTFDVYQMIGSAIRGLSQGQVHWDAFIVIGRFIAGQILRFREWGFLLPVVGLLLVGSLRLRYLRGNPATASLFFLTLTFGLAVVGAHYMAAYSPNGPSFVYEWLAREFNRVAMPAGLTLTLLAVLVFSERFGLHERNVPPASVLPAGSPEV